MYQMQRGVGMRYLSVFLALSVGVSAGASIVNTIPAPDGDIIGMAWQDNGSLWAVDHSTGWVFELDPSDGTVLFSFFPDLAVSYTIYGVAVSNDTLFINYGKGTGGGQYSMYDCDTGVFLENVGVC